MLDERWPAGQAEVAAELRRLAKSYMRKERAGHTLQTTALIHEAYLRLIDAGHGLLNECASWRSGSLYA